MKKEWVLLAGTVLVTLGIALGLIRWLAPGLLGVASDLQLVQIDEKLPPFYEGVFRRADFESADFILKDPLTRVRARPLSPAAGGLGPTDILGFRNHRVPNIADVVVIGDSQTYGNNALLEENWPSQMARGLRANATVYSMATGGWGAVQYLDMFANANLFQPQVAVVAFYSGNDPLESFQMAYGVPAWDWLIPDRQLTKSDGPEVVFPAPQAQWWAAKFDDGVATIFTPTLRLAANQSHPAVNAGYAIMRTVADRIVQMAQPAGVQLVFTVVPTKELVYAGKVAAQGLQPPPDYQQLVEREQAHIERLGAYLAELPGARYVDLVAPLQQAALRATPLYPADSNGHPLAAGYAVIGQTIAAAVAPHLPEPPQGLLAVKQGQDAYSLYLARRGAVWLFQSPQLVAANGWSLEGIPIVQPRQLAGLPLRGVIRQVDPSRYGPTFLDTQPATAD